MATITIYEARQVEITEPKYYLYNRLTGWAFMITPDSNDVKNTTASMPFDENDMHYYADRVAKSTEITEAEFYEIVASNYSTHLNHLAKMAQEWGLEMQTLKEFNEEQMMAQVKYDEGRDLINEAKQERELETADRNPTDWSN